MLCSIRKSNSELAKNPTNPELWKSAECVYPTGTTAQAVLAANIWSSLQIALCGFGLAPVIGIPLGWFMGWYRDFDAFMRPIFEIIRPIPPVSWIPLITLWFGAGEMPKVLIVIFGSIASNIEEAVYLAERVLILTNKPAKIKEEVLVDLPRPRKVSAPRVHQDPQPHHRSDQMVVRQT